VRVRSLVAGAVALLAFGLATAVAAPAGGLAHGKSVWFSTVELGPGDQVRGDLDVVFGTVVCTPGAVIDGNVRTFFGTFEQLDGCEVDGTVAGVSDGESVPWMGPLPVGNAAAGERGILRKLGWDVVVVLAFLLFPVRVRIAIERIENHPGLSGATGAVAAVAAVPLVVLLVLSVIGIPLVPIAVAIAVAALWIGNAAVALTLGRRLVESLVPETTASPLGALLLGLLVVTAAQSLPLIGWAVTALFFLLGLGAAILAFVRETTYRAFVPAPGRRLAPPSGP